MFPCICFRKFQTDDSGFGCHHYRTLSFLALRKLVNKPAASPVDTSMPQGQSSLAPASDVCCESSADVWICSSCATRTRPCFSRVTCWQFVPGLRADTRLPSIVLQQSHVVAVPMFESTCPRRARQLQPEGFFGNLLRNHGCDAQRPLAGVNLNASILINFM